MNRTLRLSLVVLLMAGGLAACGKRGQLDPPPAQKQAAEPGVATPAASETSRAGRTRRVPLTAPKRDLLIDRILD